MSYRLRLEAGRLGEKNGARLAKKQELRCFSSCARSLALLQQPANQLCARSPAFTCPPPPPAPAPALCPRPQPQPQQQSNSASPESLPSFIPSTRLTSKPQ